jgi:broad specificity phosphatase PhoE
VSTRASLKLTKGHRFVTVRLVLVSHAATGATLRGSFPDDEPIDTHLSPPPLGRVVAALTGPERRCVQTGRLFGLEATVDPALRDCDYGRWRGRGLDEINVTEPNGVLQWLADPTSAIHGGESLLALLARVASWLDSTDFPAGKVAVFTHPAVVRAALVHALQAAPRTFWRIDVSPLGRALLSGNPGHWTLKEITVPRGMTPEPFARRAGKIAPIGSP